MNWIKKSGVECELIVSIDNDDPKKTDYIDRYFNEDSVERILIYNDNKSVVDATNIAAKKAQGDILIYLSDDFACPDNWGSLVLKEFLAEGDKP